MAGDLIRKGAFVQICSLKRTEFNGRQGIVLGKHAGDEGKPARARVAMSFFASRNLVRSDRWTVDINYVVALNVRSENLIVLPPGSAKDPAPVSDRAATV